MKKRTVFLGVLVVAAAAAIYLKSSDSKADPADALPTDSIASPSDSSSASPSSDGEEPSESPSKDPGASTDDPAPPSESQPSDDGNSSGNSGGSFDGLSEDAMAALIQNLPDENVKTVDGKAIVTNATSTLVVVNKKRELSSSYEPDDLVVPDIPFSFSGDSPKKKMRKVAADAIEELFAGAKEDGIKLAGVSGYRAYSTQKAIFQSNADKKGEEVANRTSARPGQSEHQTGLAMDVSSASAGYELEEKFADTKEGKWLAEHAADYGFIIRFLKGKEDITGYSYEPWHIRYVGKEVAQDIMKNHLTLEEFFDAVEVSAKASN